MKTKSVKRKSPARRTARAARSGKSSTSSASAVTGHVYGKQARQTSSRRENMAALIQQVIAAMPRYNTNLRYGDGSRYPAAASTTPTGKAKVKLELQSRSDTNLVGFGHSCAEAMLNNPNFPTAEQQPTPAIFDAKLAEFEGILAQLDNLRLMAKGLTDQRDIVRVEFEALFGQRGTYVELASGGDANIILSAGLPVRNGRTPVGVLPFPGDLRVDLNGVEGEMVVRWTAVKNAKGYMLQMAEVKDGVAGEFSLAYTGGKFSTRLTGMPLGKNLAFRVAAVGGEDGKSPWSPEVWRTVG